MKALPYSQVINQGIKQLSLHQEKDGSFRSFLSSNEHNFSKANTYQTTFLSLIIFLATTSFASTEKVIHIRKKLVKFLLSQKSEYWTWNYLKRGSQEAKDTPYPDDLDDTFCALAGLSQFDKKLITGDVFAHVVKILTFAEEKEGGPYRTWLIKKSASKKWQDIDFAVNSNIAYFLSLHEISLPNLEKYFDKSIHEEKIESPYYPSFYAPLYFLSRFYTGKHKKVIINLLLKERSDNASFENPLKTALAVLTLINLGVPKDIVKPSIEYLIKTQKNGLWSAYGFCINQIKNEVKYFAGSSSLTTAFCLTAIHTYQLAEQKITKEDQSQIEEDKQKKQLHELIIQRTMQRFSHFDETIYDNATMLLQRILKHDKSQQIPLLPYYFFKSLKKQDKKISKDILIKLGMANIFGWIAYTIFDDFLDDEGNPIFLPLATIALRKLTYLFDTFPLQEKNVQELFHTFINRIDSANAWELNNCRIKNDNFIHENFEQLSNKSIGHALGPLTILLILGYSQKSKEFVCIETFFKHYLVTKQLNDDAHDWEKDFKKGHLTPVVSLLLKKADEKNIAKNRKNLYELFWLEIIQEVWELIHAHARKARTALRKSLVFKDTYLLESLLETHVKSADKALEEQKNIIAFFNTYTIEKS